MTDSNDDPVPLDQRAKRVPRKRDKFSCSAVRYDKIEIRLLKMILPLTKCVGSRDDK